MRNDRLTTARIMAAPWCAQIPAVKKARSTRAKRQTRTGVQREARWIPQRGVRRSAIAGRDPRGGHKAFNHTDEGCILIIRTLLPNHRIAQAWPDAAAAPARPA